jgi:hypothetical protein
MDTSSSDGHSTGRLLSEQDGRTPRVVNPPIHSSRQIERLKKSTYYGILIYLQDIYRQELSENQLLWIIYYSRKLDENQLLKAVNIYSQLKTEDVFYRRMRPQIERIRSSVPRLEPKQLAEVRRIGTGYHDKGSLRPLHQRRSYGELPIWDEDISYLLPLTYEIRGTWITAEEASELIGVNQIQLALGQLLTMSSNHSLSNPK